MNRRRLITVSIAIAIGVGLFFYSAHHPLKNYPGSERIFKKYYPENEIVGLAFDKNWREVRSSNDAIDVINHWYDNEFSIYTEVENRSDLHCSIKSWQQGEVVKLRVTICDHGNYRSILTTYR